MDQWVNFVGLISLVRIGIVYTPMILKFQY